jgi:hypothetical protein
MSSKTPKTGLAVRMRDWMKGCSRLFSVGQLCSSLAIPQGKERDKVGKAISDFIKRGEISIVVDKRIRRQPGKRYRYNRGWKKSVPKPVADKIYKAMYVSVSFTGPEIRRLAEVEETGYMLRLIRELLESGMIQVVGRRRCAHGAGAERQYHIPNRDRFRLEVMK